MEPIQDLLHPIVADLVRKAPLSDAKVLCAWRMAVGPGLSRVSHVLASPGGLIDVKVDDAQWLGELERSRAVILARLRAVLGAEVARVLSFQAPAQDDRRRTRAARQVRPLVKPGR